MAAKVIVIAIAIGLLCVGGTAGDNVPTTPSDGTQAIGGSTAASDQSGERSAKAPQPNAVMVQTAAQAHLSTSAGVASTIPVMTLAFLMFVIVALIRRSEEQDSKVLLLHNTLTMSHNADLSLQYVALGLWWCGLGNLNRELRLQPDRWEAAYGAHRTAMKVHGSLNEVQSAVVVFDKHFGELGSGVWALYPLLFESKTAELVEENSWYSKVYEQTRIQDADGRLATKTRDFKIIEDKVTDTLAEHCIDVHNKYFSKHVRQLEDLSDVTATKLADTLTFKRAMCLFNTKVKTMLDSFPYHDGQRALLHATMMLKQAQRLGAPQSIDAAFIIGSVYRDAGLPLIYGPRVPLVPTPVIGANAPIPTTLDIEIMSAAALFVVLRVLDAPLTRFQADVVIATIMGSKVVSAVTTLGKVDRSFDSVEYDQLMSRLASLATSKQIAPVTNQGAELCLAKLLDSLSSKHIPHACLSFHSAVMSRVGLDSITRCKSASSSSGF